MRSEISKSDFRDAFARCGRKDQFSYDALGVIYDYLEEANPDSELDPIAVCCEFTEYEDLEAFQAEYDAEQYTSIEDIAEMTAVLNIDDTSFVIQQF